METKIKIKVKSIYYYIILLTIKFSPKNYENSFFYYNTDNFCNEPY